MVKVWLAFYSVLVRRNDANKPLTLSVKLIGETQSFVNAHFYVVVTVYKYCTLTSASSQLRILLKCMFFFSNSIKKRGIHWNRNVCQWKLLYCTEYALNTNSRLEVL